MVSSNKSNRYIPVHERKSTLGVWARVQHIVRGDWPAYMDTLDEEDPWLTESWFTKLLPMPTFRASFYKPDCWHIVNLGVGKSFAANALVMFLPLWNANSVEEGLQLMSRAFSSFCSNSESALHFECSV